MDKKLKYRIVENCGKYRIQIYAYEIRGILWQKRKVWSWETTNTWGGVRSYYPIPQPSSGNHKTLKDAKKMVEMWRRGDKYHKA